MSEPDSAVATVRQPWTLRTLLARGAAARSAGQDVAVSVALRAFIGSRLLVWLAAVGTVAIFGRNATEISLNDPNHLSAPFSASWANLVFAPAARWDSVWYLQIAHVGYFSRSSSAFFPLYPLLIHVGATLLGSELGAGLLISIGSFAAASYLLYLLTRLDLSDEAARTTVFLVAFFPTAFFLSAVYTESLFLMLSVGAIYAARRDRWMIASVLGCLAAGSRSNGVLILVPLLVLYLYGPRGGVRGGAPRSSWRWPSWSALWLALVPLGLIAYLVYLWVTHDAPLAPFQVLYFWRRHFAGPFGAVWHLALALPHDVQRILSGTTVPVTPGEPISWTTHDLIDLGFLAFAAAGLVWSWRRLPVAYFLYAVVMLAQALSYPTPSEPLESFPRYMLVVFPLFMGWGAKLADRSAVRRTTLLVSAGVLAAFSGLWGYWAWVA